MKRALILISSDPQKSPRAAEGMRVAASLAAWGRVAVAVYVGEAAAAILGGDAEWLTRGDELARCAAILREAGAAIYCASAAPGAQRAPAEELARLAAGRHCVMRF